MVEQGREPLDDGEAETKSLAAISLDVADLIELLKDVGQAILGDADAGVPHLNPQRLAASPAADQDLAVIGIADGIGYQVLDNPLQQCRIGTDNGGCWPNPERQPPVTGERSKLDPNAVEQCREREIRQPGLNDTGVEP